MKYEEPNPQIDGWMGREELQWLCDQAAGCRVIVEVGSWCGRSTHALLTGCPGVVWAVDHFRGSPSEPDVHKRAKTDDIYAEFLRNVGSFWNLRVLKMDSVEASRFFEDGSVDMVFIDGDHSYDAVCRDLAAWKPKAKFLCGHDRGMDGVPEALKQSGIKVSSGPGSIWIADPAGADVTERAVHVSVDLKPLSLIGEEGLV